MPESSKKELRCELATLKEKHERLTAALLATADQMAKDTQLKDWDEENEEEVSHYSQESRILLARYCEQLRTLAAMGKL